MTSNPAHDSAATDLLTAPGPAHLDTTGRHLTERVEDMHDKLAEHYSRPRPQRVCAAGYDAEDIKAVFGG